MSVILIDEIIRLFKEMAGGLSDGSLRVKDSDRIGGMTLEQLKEELNGRNKKLAIIQIGLIIVHTLFIVLFLYEW